MEVLFRISDGLAGVHWYCVYLGTCNTPNGHHMVFSLGPWYDSGTQVISVARLDIN